MSVGLARYVSRLSMIAAVLVTTWADPAPATQLAYDGFGLSFPLYANSGTGFVAPWTQGGFNVGASDYSFRPRSLCYPKLDSSRGGSVAAAPASFFIEGALRTLRQPLGTDNTTAYVSFLIQPQANDGFSFFGLTLNGSLGNDLFIGKPGGGAIDEYVVEHRGGFGQLTSGVPAVVGRTALLVVKAQFMAGNDVFTLYVNPEPGRPEPSSTVVKTDLNLGTVSRIGIYSVGAFLIDEIRIGTTFADVVPRGDNTPDPDFPGCL
jgi:hypothetical protein